MAWKIVSAAMMAAGLLGCSVHSQAPIRQVAYDFSDHAYYDRDFAPSPNYAEGQGYYGHAWAAPVAQQQHVHVSHVEGSCGCDHDHEGHAAPSARGNDDESATNDREEPRRAARPRVDFDGDRDGSVASGRVNERDADTSDDSSRRRPRFTTSRPAASSTSSASEGEGRAEPAARPVSTRPEVSRPAEAQSRRAAPAAGRPMAAPEARRSMKTSGDDRIAGR